MLPNLQLPLQLFKNENVELSNQRMNLRPRRRQPIINNTQQSRIPNANNWDLDVNSTAFQDVMAGRPIGSQAFIDKLQRDETALKEHSSLIRDWGNSWIVPFGKRQTQLDEEHDVSFFLLRVSSFFKQYRLKFQLKRIISMTQTMTTKNL